MNNVERALMAMADGCGWSNDPRDSGDIGDNHVSPDTAHDLEVAGYATLHDTGHGYCRIYLTDKGRAAATNLMLREIMA